MTRAYVEWSRLETVPEAREPVPWTRFVPPGWQGFCCHCRRRLTVADWQEARIVASGDGDPWHCLCLSHLNEGEREYRAAVRALARAVAGV